MKQAFNFLRKSNTFGVKFNPAINSKMNLVTKLY